MKRSLTALIGTLALAVAPLVAAATPAPGTILSGTLNQSFDSGKTQVGTPLTLTNVSSTDGSISNATVYGHVINVVKAGQGTPGKIELGYEKLRLSNGATYAVSGRTTNLTVNTKNNALKEGIGAVVGMVAGNILGKWVGTNIGGVIGAGGGFLYAKNNRQNVTVPANSNVTLQLTRSRAQSRS
jgi:hypothetical protein